MARYTYLSREYRNFGAQHGTQCDPVRRANGKCIVGRGGQLVRFENGVVAVVVRRALRLNSKLEAVQS